MNIALLGALCCCQTEFRLGSMTERLNSELEEERTKSRDSEEKLRILEEVRARGEAFRGGGYLSPFLSVTRPRSPWALHALLGDTWRLEGSVVWFSFSFFFFALQQ